MVVRILQGDCRQVLRGLPDESVHCCVTSPPYWGLRDYGLKPVVWGGEHDCRHRWADGGAFCRSCNAWLGSLGLEPTPELFAEHVVEVFDEVGRVLRKDGTLWVNLGDTYATGAGKVGDRPGGGRQGNRWASSDGVVRRGIGPMTQPNRMRLPGLKPKDLVGVPWRIAFALQSRGWWLRSDVIWTKPNPMPESVTDRPTKAHEYVFLFTKARRYFFDAVAVQEPVTGNAHARGRGINPKAARGDGGLNVKQNSSFSAAVTDRVSRRNVRTVWPIASRPFPGAHFAVFPSPLAERCIRAGTSEMGCCPDCGASWIRIADRRAGTGGRRPAVSGDIATPAETGGWRAVCSCGNENPVPCTVLDPFAGSGTTGLAAARLHRDAVLVELNADYCEMAQRRIEEDAPLLAEVQRRQPHRE